MNKVKKLVVILLIILCNGCERCSFGDARKKHLISIKKPQ